jgi:hypothetical protein
MYHWATKNTGVAIQLHNSRHGVTAAAMNGSTKDAADSSAEATQCGTNAISDASEHAANSTSERVEETAAVLVASRATTATLTALWSASISSLRCKPGATLSDGMRNEPETAGDQLVVLCDLIDDPENIHNAFSSLLLSFLASHE